MMKLVFLALVSTAFCGVLVDKADFDSIGVELEDDKINTDTTNIKVPPKTKVNSKPSVFYYQFGDDTTRTKLQTNTKVTTETKVTPETKVDRETIYKTIVDDLKTMKEFNTLKTNLKTIVLNQIVNILTLDLTEVKEIKTMLVNKGLEPNMEHITGLLKIWLELPTTTITKTIEPETNVVHDTETTVDSVYQKVEKIFTNDERLKEDLMKLEDTDIISTDTTNEKLQKVFDALISQSDQDAVTKALFLFRWNVMSQKLFEVTKKLSLVIKECKFPTSKITDVVKAFYRSRSLSYSLRKNTADKCMLSKTQELWNQLYADDSVHNVDMFLIKSFLTVYMKEFVAKNGMGLTQYYENDEQVVGLKNVITKYKLPFYVTLDVVYNVCPGHYSMFQDKIPSEVAKVTAFVCRAERDKTFEMVKLVSYLYKEQLN